MFFLLIRTEFVLEQITLVCNYNLAGKDEYLFVTHVIYDYF